VSNSAATAAEGGSGVASPIKFAHVVLKTRNYDEMVAWWSDFLEATPRHSNPFITFLSYDDEHHRLAIAKMPHLADRVDNTVGIEHFAFTYATLDDLLGQYERMGARGVRPYWTINHGMTLSAYYRDPDGNQVETQVDTLSLAEAETFMASPAFAANPIGIDVDFEAIVARRRSGASVESLVDYSTAGK
jgi:catechol-2,3-dioxygenase